MMRATIALGLLSACTLTHEDPPKPKPTDSTIEIATYPAIPTTKLDIVFQIDNSPGVAEVQRDFTNAIPDFIAALDAMPGGRPDLHIAVVDSDLGSFGSATGITAPDLGNCTGGGHGGNFLTSGAPVSGTFISDVEVGDGPIVRSTNYTGELVAALQMMMKVNARGCGFEQQLSATRIALDGNPQNAGFARADANLLVVVITDEDDCSVRDSELLVQANGLGPPSSYRCTQYGLTCREEMDTDGPKTHCEPNEDSQYVDGIKPYVDFFSSLRGDRSRTAVAVIAAPPSSVNVSLVTPTGGTTPQLTLDHICEWQGATDPAFADPAVRLGSLTDQLQSHGLFRSVCGADQTEHAREIVNLANQMSGVVCLDPTLDTSTCVVTVENGDASRDVPACKGTPTSATRSRPT